MALTRAALRELGITEKDQLDAIMDAHGASIEAAKEKAKELAETAAQKAIGALQAKVDSLPTDSEDWKAKYEAEVAAHQATVTAKDTAFNDLKTAVETEKTNAAKQAKLRKQLADDGANPDLVDLLEMKFDLSKIEIDGDKIKGWDALSKPVKEQYAAVFGTTTTTGAAVATPPTNQTGTAYTLDQLKQMSPAEINANWDKGIKQALGGK